MYKQRSRRMLCSVMNRNVLVCGVCGQRRFCATVLKFFRVEALVWARFKGYIFEGIEPASLRARRSIHTYLYFVFTVQTALRPGSEWMPPLSHSQRVEWSGDRPPAAEGGASPDKASAGLPPASGASSALDKTTPSSSVHSLAYKLLRASV